MSLNKLIQQVKSISPMERGQVTLPMMDGADIGEIFDRFLNPDNIGFLSYFRGRQIPTIALGFGLCELEDSNDDRAFLLSVLRNYSMFTVTEKGLRSSELTKIASGYLQMQQEIEIEQAKKDQGLLGRITSLGKNKS